MFFPITFESIATDEVKELARVDKYTVVDSEFRGVIFTRSVRTIFLTPTHPSTVRFTAQDLILIARRRFQAYQTCVTQPPPLKQQKHKKQSPKQDEPPLCARTFFDMFCGASIGNHSWLSDAIRTNEWIKTPRDMTRAMNLVVQAIDRQRELDPGDETFCIKEEEFRELIREKPIAAL